MHYIPLVSFAFQIRWRVKSHGSCLKRGFICVQKCSGNTVCTQNATMIRCLEGVYVLKRLHGNCEAEDGCFADRLTQLAFSSKQPRINYMQCRVCHLKRSQKAVTEVQKLNQKQIYPRVIDYPGLFHDTCVKVTLVARPLLTPVARTRCIYEYNVFIIEHYFEL
jgi:hypothetical protein